MDKLLIMALFISALYQPSRDRLMVGVMLITMTFTHYYFLNEATGFLYYFSASLANLLIIFMILLSSCSQMAKRLSIVLLASISVNFYGWVIYELYYPPITYNNLYIVLYIWAIIVLVSKEKLYDRANHDSESSIIPSHGCGWCFWASEGNR